MTEFSTPKLYVDKGDVDGSDYEYYDAKQVREWAREMARIMGSFVEASIEHKLCKLSKEEFESKWGKILVEMADAKRELLRFANEEEAKE